MPEKNELMRIEERLGSSLSGLLSDAAYVYQARADIAWLIRQLKAERKETSENAARARRFVSSKLGSKNK